MVRRNVIFAKDTQHESSLSYNGVDEIMRNLANTPIGMKEDFSVMLWLNPAGGWGGGTVFRIDNVKSGGPTTATHSPSGEFTIDISAQGFVISALFWVRDLTSPFAVQFRTAGGFAGIGFNAWHQIVVTNDSATLDPGIQIYVDGVRDLSVSTSGFFGNTMADITRDFWIGGHEPLAFTYEGLIYSMATWDNILAESEVAEIYNSGDGRFELLLNQGNYTSAGNLQHWWKQGFIESDVGADFAMAPKRNISNNALNMDSADIVSSFPS